MSDIEDKIPSVIEAVRQNLGLEWDDDSEDERIARMPRKELFRRYMTWNGIIGYEETILGVIEEIYEIELEEKE